MEQARCCLFGIDSMPALPALLFSDEARMRVVGF
jgi:hypothetical protein